LTESFKERKIPPIMISERPLLRLFDYAALKRYFLIILGLSLLPIAETALYYWAYAIWSAERVLALTAATGFLGFFYLTLRVRRLIRQIGSRIEEGIFPEQQVVRLLGVLFGGVLLLLPGFISDALGLLILLTFLKRVAGRVLLRIFGVRIKGAYEYLKLS
jgi:UPF0716 protein FxsA